MPPPYSSNGSNDNPKVSVLMPVHGAQAYIGKAIESILDQTFSDFELIIISEPETELVVIEKIEGYRDDRIRHHRNTKRLGLERSLNLALEMARGEYIARMDSDDMSEKQRIEKQCQYLDEHPDIAVLGSKAYIIDEKNTVLGEYHAPTDPAVIGWRTLYNNCIVNSSSMMRKIVPHTIGDYNPDYRTAEDYEYWTRVLEFFKIVNYPELLVFYRINPYSISNVQKERQIATGARISQQCMEMMLGRKIGPEVMRTMRFPYKGASYEVYEMASRITMEMCQKYVHKRRLGHDESKKVIEIATREYWNLVARAAGGDPANSWKVIGRAVMSRPPRPELDDIVHASGIFREMLKIWRKKRKEPSA